MSAVLDPVAKHRLSDLAERFGVTHKTIWWWANRWYPDRPHGCRAHPLLVTDVDVMVLRAIFAITDRTRGRAPSPVINRAEAAIRRDPRRWLLIDGRRAETFDEVEDAGLAWLWSHDTPAATLIDLWSVPEAAA